MAFGAFLAGMVLAETEFRQQVQSAIRPFRDVLLGLFFVSRRCAGPARNEGSVKIGCSLIWQGF